MTTPRSVLVIIGLAAGAAACHEGPSSPTPPGPLATVTLDTIRYPAASGQPNLWQGVSVFAGDGGAASALALDGLHGRLRYYGCAVACDKSGSWVVTSIDSSESSQLEQAGGATASAAGVDVVYDGAQGIRYLHCDAACGNASEWTAANLFAGAVVGGGFDGNHQVPLASDRSGGLHLLFGEPGDTSLHYAHCASGCTNLAQWDDRQIVRSLGDWSWSARTIAVAPAGAVHVFLATDAGLTHAACAADCASGGTWSVEVIPGDSTFWAVASLSVAFDGAGRLHLAWTRYDRKVRYATCAAPCQPPATWSTTVLPLTAYDVSLAADPRGGLVLATTANVVQLSRCAGGCSDAAIWITTPSDSALGFGTASMAIDAVGRVHVASAYGGFPAVLQYSESR